MFPLKRCVSASEVDGLLMSRIPNATASAASADGTALRTGGEDQTVSDHLAEVHAVAGSRYMRLSRFAGSRPDDVDGERVTACALLCEAMALRRKYRSFSLGDQSSRGQPIPSLEEFSKDFARLLVIEASGPVRTFAHGRTAVLQSAFDMHFTLNHRQEDHEATKLPADFYSVAKVDNHVHLAAGMPATDFRDFIEEKRMHEADVEVLPGRTLASVLLDAGLNPSERVTVDKLEVMGDYQTFQRFDKFNSKYSPFKSEALRTVFLKTDNFMQGRYFAEITARCIARLEANGSTFAEYRVSVYGRKPDEWQSLAKWLLGNTCAAVRAKARVEAAEAGDPGAASDPTHGCLLSPAVMWQVQVPRLWSVLGVSVTPFAPGAATSSSAHLASPPPPVHAAAAGGRAPVFADMLANLFGPMVDATLAPEDHPEVAEALRHVGGLDSVDDESRAEASFDSCKGVGAEAWPADGTNPHYAWQLYHLWANLAGLNRLRAARGLNTLSLRPHAGECAGSGTHLAAAYLLAQSINHGVELRNSISLRYLYLLDQVGLSVAPLSNDFLFLRLKESPFPKFLALGMNVTLSTDDPLLFHLSSEPLLEEYSVARVAFSLSMTDLCEVARNSVAQSDFGPAFKTKWLGSPSSDTAPALGLSAGSCPAVGSGGGGCDAPILRTDGRFTNVPALREAFRGSLLGRERNFVRACGGNGSGGSGKASPEGESGSSVMRAAFAPFSPQPDAPPAATVDPMRSTRLDKEPEKDGGGGGGGGGCDSAAPLEKRPRKGSE